MRGAQRVLWRRLCLVANQSIFFVSKQLAIQLVRQQCLVLVLLLLLVAMDASRRVIKVKQPCLVFILAAGVHGVAAAAAVVKSEIKMIVMETLDFAVVVLVDIVAHVIVQLSVQRLFKLIRIHYRERLVRQRGAVTGAVAAAPAFSFAFVVMLLAVEVVDVAVYHGVVDRRDIRLERKKRVLLVVVVVLVTVVSGVVAALRLMFSEVRAVVVEGLDQVCGIFLFHGHAVEPVFGSFLLMQAS